MDAQKEKFCIILILYMKKPKLILVDNNLTFRQRLTFLINVENSAEIIGKASTGDDFIELLTNYHPDLILMDIDIPQLDGIEVVKKAFKMLPELKIFALTMFGDDEYIISLIKMGVIGFILKSSAIYELDKDIHSLLTVENYCINNQILNIIIKSSAIRVHAQTKIKKTSNLLNKNNYAFNRFE